MRQILMFVTFILLTSGFQVNTDITLSSYTTMLRCGHTDESAIVMLIDP